MISAFYFVVFWMWGGKKMEKFYEEARSQWGSPEECYRQNTVTEIFCLGIPVQPWLMQYTFKHIHFEMKSTTCSEHVNSRIGWCITMCHKNRAFAKALDALGKVCHSHFTNDGFQGVKVVAGVDEICPVILKDLGILELFLCHHLSFILMAWFRPCPLVHMGLFCSQV